MYAKYYTANINSTANTTNDPATVELNVQLEAHRKQTEVALEQIKKLISTMQASMQASGRSISTTMVPPKPGRVKHICPNFKKMLLYSLNEYFKLDNNKDKSPTGYKN